MKKYAKIVNEETKLCEVGLGTNFEFYKSIGMIEQEVELGYDEKWYLKGYAPTPSKEILQNQARNIRNALLKSTDIYMLSDYSMENSEKENYKNYRQYLRDYPTLKNWYKENPLSFEEWKKSPVITKEKTIQDEIDEYQKYLDETDWYALRQMETRKATPYAVLIKRNEARDKISELRNKLKEGKE